MKVKLILLLILPIYLLLNVTFAQQKVSKKILFQLTEVELQTKSIVQISPKRDMIIKEIQGDKFDFFLSHIDNPTEKKLLFAAYEDQKPMVNFNQTGDYIYYTFMKNGKYILGIYERDTDKKIFIRDEKNNIASSWEAVSPDNGKIIYQVREEGALPKIYMAQPDGSSPQFITYGMGERWSPNGKLFAVKCPENINDFKPKKKQGNNSNIKKSPRKNIKWVYKIFSENGNSLISLGEYSPTSLFLWSHNSKYILLKKLYEIDFSILELANKQEGLQIINNYSISPTQKEKVGLGIPSWSPDSKSIVYKISFLDMTGHSYEKNEICVSTIDGKKSLKIQEDDSSTEKSLVWSNDGKIIMQDNGSVKEISINDF